MSYTLGIISLKSVQSITRIINMLTLSLT